MKVKVSSGITHPEGWHTFKIMEEEAISGTFGPQIKWKLQSSEKDEDGNPIPMTYFTGTVLSQNEKCKLTNMFIACGVIEKAQELDDEDDWDTSILIGRSFDGRVDEKVSEKGTFFNIGAVRPAKKKGKKKADEDPFEDE